MFKRIWIIRLNTIQVNNILEKISAALGKLEIALKNFSKNIHKIEKYYDFSI